MKTRTNPATASKVHSGGATAQEIGGSEDAPSTASEPSSDAATVTARKVLARFAGYYRPYKSLFFFDLVCASVLAAVDLAFPQFLNFFTKQFFLEPPGVILSTLGWIALGFAALYALRTACQYFITAWGHIMGARM